MLTVTAFPSDSTTKSVASGVPETASENFIVIALLPSDVKRETIDGTVVSIAIASACPSAPVVPIVGSVKVTALPAVSLIVPTNDVVEAYVKSDDELPAATV